MNLRRFSQLLDESFTTPNGDHRVSAGSWTLAADIIEEQGALTLVADLPGVNPQDVKLSVENGVLTLSGVKQSGAAQSEGRAHVLERSFGEFARTFVLPKTVDVERINAAYANGVLTVTLPKAEKAMAREIKVNVA